MDTSTTDPVCPPVAAISHHLFTTTPLRNFILATLLTLTIFVLAVPCFRPLFSPPPSSRPLTFAQSVFLHPASPRTPALLTRLLVLTSFLLLATALFVLSLSGAVAASQRCAHVSGFGDRRVLVLVVYFVDTLVFAGVLLLAGATVGVTVWGVGRRRGCGKGRVEEGVEEEGGSGEEGGEEGEEEEEERMEAGRGGSRLDGWSVASSAGDTWLDGDGRVIR